MHIRFTFVRSHKLYKSQTGDIKIYIFDCYIKFTTACTIQSGENPLTPNDL
jgi:hypothetical protein